MSGTIEQLKELKELLDQGVLTQEEFDGQKKAILEKPKTTQVSPEPIIAQPATMQPGMSQPCMMQPGMMQPGMMQPGMMQPGMMQPGMMQPGMMPGMMMAHGGRPPPPGCPPGGQYVMVKWCGPQTQQGADFCKLIGCLTLPGGLICCCIGMAMENDPKDDKEVYKVNGNHYTPTGTLDLKVGPGPYTHGARG